MSSTKKSHGFTSGDRWNLALSSFGSDSLYTKKHIKGGYFELLGLAKASVLGHCMAIKEIPTLNQ